MVNEHTRHFRDAFFLRRKNTTVAGDYAIVTVDDNWIDEAELPKGRSQFCDLLRRVRPCVIYIWNQPGDRDKLHICRCLHRISPHSANFSKPPSSSMYFLAVSTISE